MGEWAGVSHVHAVHLSLQLVVGGGGGTSAVGVNLSVVHSWPRQELDGLRQSQLLNRVVAEDHTLHLGDEHVILRRLGEPIALTLIQVHEVGPGLILQGSIRGAGLCRASEEGNGQIGGDGASAQIWLASWESDGDGRAAHGRHIHWASVWQTRNVLANLDAALAERADGRVDGEHLSRGTSGGRGDDLSRAHRCVKGGVVASDEATDDIRGGRVGEGDDDVGHATRNFGVR